MCFHGMMGVEGRDTNTASLLTFPTPFHPHSSLSFKRSFRLECVWMGGKVVEAVSAPSTPSCVRTGVETTLSLLPNPHLRSSHLVTLSHLWTLRQTLSHLRWSQGPGWKE